ncbi:hypothetical protein T4B_1485 [Trichinella pseudospiralis]|nr:hypothetical protein T4B_9409 [Trichinella pseudospiralis]KRZ05258.1 hypothetical protein T4B_1485 [Trichinella pseudospiralis]
MGHINLHIIKYGNFVGKILLEMQFAFLIDVVIATDNVILHEHPIDIIETITSHKSSIFITNNDGNNTTTISISFYYPFSHMNHFVYRL